MGVPSLHLWLQAESASYDLPGFSSAWYGAFSKQKEDRRAGIALERAGVLFNIAAFLTQAADAYDDTATANHQLLTPHAMAVRTLSRRIPRVKKGLRRCAGASRGRPASSPISRLPHPTPYPPTSGFGYF